jgi:hypothetical protein
MQTATPLEVLREERGGIAWGPAAAFDNGAIALVDQHLNAGPCTFFLVRLDSVGRLVAQSKPIPVMNPTDGGEIAVTSKSKALMVVRDRKDEDFQRGELACQFSYDQPRWFTCSWKSNALDFEEVDFWKDMDAGGIRATSHPNWTSWTMVTTTYAKEPEVSVSGRLAFGFGSGLKPPVLHEVDVPCHDVAHLAENEQQLLALTVSEYKEVKLWRLTAGGTASELAQISPRNQRKGEISGPAILRLSDGYLPDHLLPMKHGILALTGSFSREPYFWTLQARYFDSL